MTEEAIKPDENGRPTFQRSVEAQLIHGRLKEARVGDVVTYAELSKLVGGDPRFVCLSALNTALKAAQGEDGMVFHCVRTVGYKRLNDGEIVQSATQDVKAIRRKAKRAARRVAVADYEKLNDTEKLEHNTQLSVLGVLAACSSGDAARKVSRRIEYSGQHEPLPAMKFLEAMGR